MGLFWIFILSSLHFAIIESNGKIPLPCIHSGSRTCFRALLRGYEQFERDFNSIGRLVNSTLETFHDGFRRIPAVAALGSGAASKSNATTMVDLAPDALAELADGFLSAIDAFYLRADALYDAAVQVPEHSWPLLGNMTESVQGQLNQVLHQALYNLNVLVNRANWRIIKLHTIAKNITAEMNVDLAQTVDEFNRRSDSNDKLFFDFTRALSDASNTLAATYLPQEIQRSLDSLMQPMIDQVTNAGSSAAKLSVLRLKSIIENRLKTPVTGISRMNANRMRGLSSQVREKHSHLLLNVSGSLVQPLEQLKRQLGEFQSTWNAALQASHDDQKMHLLLNRADEAESRLADVTKSIALQQLGQQASSEETIRAIDGIYRELGQRLNNSLRSQAQDGSVPHFISRLVSSIGSETALTDASNELHRHSDHVTSAVQNKLLITKENLTSEIENRFDEMKQSIRHFVKTSQDVLADSSSHLAVDEIEQASLSRKAVSDSQLLLRSSKKSIEDSTSRATRSAHQLQDVVVVGAAERTRDTFESRNRLVNRITVIQDRAKRISSNVRTLSDASGKTVALPSDKSSELINSAVTSLSGLVTQLEHDANVKLVDPATFHDSSFQKARFGFGSALTKLRESVRRSLALFKAALSRIGSGYDDVSAKVREMHHIDQIDGRVDLRVLTASKILNETMQIGKRDASEQLGNLFERSSVFNRRNITESFVYINQLLNDARQRLAAVLNHADDVENDRSDVEAVLRKIQSGLHDSTEFSRSNLSSMRVALSSLNHQFNRTNARDPHQQLSEIELTISADIAGLVEKSNEKETAIRKATLMEISRILASLAETQGEWPLSEPAVSFSTTSSSSPHSGLSQREIWLTEMTKIGNRLTTESEDHADQVLLDLSSSIALLLDSLRTALNESQDEAETKFNAAAVTLKQLLSASTRAMRQAAIRMQATVRGVEGAANYSRSSASAQTSMLVNQLTQMVLETNTTAAATAALLPNKSLSDLLLQNTELVQDARSSLTGEIDSAQREVGQFSGVNFHNGSDLSIQAIDGIRRAVDISESLQSVSRQNFQDITSYVQSRGKLLAGNLTSLGDQMRAELRALITESSSTWSLLKKLLIGEEYWEKKIAAQNKKILDSGEQFTFERHAKRASVASELAAVVRDAEQASAKKIQETKTAIDAFVEEMNLKIAVFAQERR